ncbi:MAG: LamG domain-containing protein [Verrucomicrobia bacterium]|nr:LamG domain-containing protein [Verrucomicrobiota bacterium]
MKSLRRTLLSVSAFVLCWTGDSARAVLVGQWSFDTSGASQTDSSGYGNTGTLGGNATWTSSWSGRAGVISFDGNNDFIQAADSPSLSITGDMTVAAWVYVNDLSGFRSIVSKNGFIYPAGPVPYDFYLFKDTGIPSFLRGDDSTYGGATGAVAVNAGEWHHVAVTQSGTAVNFYLDGASAGSATISTPTADANQPLYIGNRGDSGTDFYGYLDDVRIYDNALSAGQIAALVPEPSSIMLVCISLGVLPLRRRLRKK